MLKWALIGSVGGYAGWRYARSLRRLDFRNRRILILGGSRGLGLAIGRILATEGAELVVAARDENELDRARLDLQQIPGANVAVTHCDVTRADSVRSVVESMAAAGGIDVLFNVAGIIQVGPLQHMADEDFGRAMDVHFWGPLHAIRAALPHMPRGTGRIVNIASIAGEMAVPHLAPYVASKFALVGLSDALQAELSSAGIRVTTVVPGLMRTGSHVNAMFKGNHEDEFTWFAVAAGLPGLSINAERAAKMIVEACRYGDAHVTLGLPARIATTMRALMPNVVAELNGLINRGLPPEGGDDGDLLRSGWESKSPWAPSWLTRTADRAVQRFNELGGHLIEELHGGGNGKHHPQRQAR